MINVSKKLKRSEEFNFIIKNLQKAYKLNDEFAVKVLITRLNNMGYKLEYGYERS